MSDSEAIKLTPNQFTQYILSGQMRPTVPVDIINCPRYTEKNKILRYAENLFEEDFLCNNAIHVMEEKCKVAGIDIRFSIPDIDPQFFPFPYTKEALQHAKDEDKSNRARMFVLRPSMMFVDNQPMQINIFNLKKIFQDKNPFGGGTLFLPGDLYDSEPFAKTSLNPSYALPTKDIVPDTLNMPWTDQQSRMSQEDTRRDPVEVVWDLLLYYANTGNRLLVNYLDSTPIHWKDNTKQVVAVGGFGIFTGFCFVRWDPDEGHEMVGACFS